MIEVCDLPELHDAAKFEVGTGHLQPQYVPQAGFTIVSLNIRAAIDHRSLGKATRIGHLSSIESQCLLSRFALTLGNGISS